MKTTQHTPEPWHVVDNDRVFDYRHTGVYGPTQCRIASVLLDADSTRIVACVNACAGLSDPASDLAALREALQAALSELENLTASIETCDLQESTDEAMAKARAALARSGKEGA